MFHLIKMLFCKHEYKYSHTLYGDAINNAPGRFVFRCVKCSKLAYKQDPETVKQR